MRTATAISRIIQFSICLIVIFGLLACASPKQAFEYESNAALRQQLAQAPAYPEISFVVLSDPHIYDSSLGTTGAAFEAYLNKDRKLLRESPEILESAISSIKNLKGSIVLVAGDLTKDGEKVSHDLAASYLAQLKAAGKKVFVVPGNHDILNGHSYKYSGDIIERVPNITADQFAQIYADFGFKDALQRDPNSLSYVAELEPGLWLLALDANRYTENVEDKESVTDGKFNAQTLAWIEKMLGQAAKENKAVIVMMHHGIMEHYAGQEKNYGEYIVDNYEEVAKLLANYNARLVFTGHYHAQDITEKKYDNGKFIFDIETGSLVTYPCPFRVVTIDKDQVATIEQESVTYIASHPENFPAYAKQYLQDGIATIATGVLTGYKIDRPEAEKIAQEIAVGFGAHYGGDEQLAPGQTMVTETGLSPLAWAVIQYRKDLILGLWKDLPPPDNNLTINLKDGSWK
ncbi:MAG: metallophosphoesterase [Dehalococcoidia bacterium]|jgi:3',5'-cyclic AMP phosphodiesterase CpdA